MPILLRSRPRETGLRALMPSSSPTHLLISSKRLPRNARLSSSTSLPARHARCCLPSTLYASAKPSLCSFSWLSCDPIPPSTHSVRTSVSRTRHGFEWHSVSLQTTETTASSNCSSLTSCDPDLPEAIRRLSPRGGRIPLPPRGVGAPPNYCV